MLAVKSGKRNKGRFLFAIQHSIALISLFPEASDPTQSPEGSIKPLSGDLSRISLEKFNVSLNLFS